MHHTPGPWTVARVPFGACEVDQVQAPDGAPICTPVQPCDGPDGADQCAANAQDRKSTRLNSSH